MRYVLAFVVLMCLLSLALAPGSAPHQPQQPVATQVAEAPVQSAPAPAHRPPPKVTVRTFTDEQVQRYVSSHPVTWIEEGQMYRVRSWVVFRRDDGSWEAHWTGWE
ncbi:MAG: hypothetical protein AB7S38_10140 [Vulcanimicrobiota bacterium]